MIDNTAQKAAGIQIEVFDIHVELFMSYLLLAGISQLTATS